MSALDRIAAALERLVQLEEARDGRRRQPRPKREKYSPTRADHAKAAAILRKAGLR